MAYTWSGYNSSTEVVLTLTEDVVSGYINLGEFRYVIDFREHDGPNDPGQLLTQLDPDGFPACAVGLEAPKQAHVHPIVAPPQPALALASAGPGIEARAGENNSVQAGFGPTVDVLVLYTPEVLTRLDSHAAIEARALSSNDQMIETIGNSDTRNTHIRIVGIEQIAYNENNGVMPHATRWYGYRVFLRTSPVVVARRNAYQADLATMLLHDNAQAYCGVAYVQRPDCDFDDPTPTNACSVGTGYNGFAYSVVHVGCALANAIYAHEVAHQFGAEHQPQYA